MTHDPDQPPDLERRSFPEGEEFLSIVVEADAVVRRRDAELKKRCFLIRWWKRLLERLARYDF